MCDILAAISYSYGYNERPRKRVKINMTIPSRPAPPPPQRNTTAPLRYTPTTDWDFCAFDSSSTSSQPATGNGHNQQQSVKAKKPPPPRPPPPKLPAAPTAPLKKPNQPQSINILSSLFGHKRGSNGATTGKPNSSGAGASSHPKHNFTSGGPVKLLPPPSAASSTKLSAGKVSNFTTFTEHHSSTNYGSFVQSARSTGAGPAAGTSTDMQLISFDSPPSSPTFTQKSCSDCISVDSFSSDSNYSSPNNGNMSQAESGFEDDFVACASNNRQQAGSSVPWGDLDPFDGSHASTTPSPAIYGTIPLATAQIRAPLINSKLQQFDFVDPLCNGQSVLPKVPIMSMPTIIKPPTSSNPESQKSTPSHSAAIRNMIVAPKTNITPTTCSRYDAAMEDNFAPDTGAFDSLTSHPMPSVPPPPPPPFTDETYTEEPYGIALYDFQGEADEDLSFKTNEKIYLLKRLNDEWYMGRDKRGLEGMFPVNYVEVKVPLATSSTSDKTPQVNVSTAAVKVRALYNFKAEAPEDLSIMENDYVAVLYQITPDWLYGEIDGRRGQFPANYIEYVPAKLPQMPTAASS